MDDLLFITALSQLSQSSSSPPAKDILLDMTGIGKGLLVIFCRKSQFDSSHLFCLSLCFESVSVFVAIICTKHDVLLCSIKTPTHPPIPPEHTH